MPANKMCPCGSGQPYNHCCGMFHAGALPPTAQTLMRSRYSAYALHLADYIIETTHPDNKDFSSDLAEWKKKILAFSTQTQFVQLEVLKAEEHPEISFVTFKAHLIQDGRPVILHEKSRFKKINGRWLYESGIHP
jgi:SEC-C motif domain protein